MILCFARRAAPLAAAALAVLVAATVQAGRSAASATLPPASARPAPSLELRDPADTRGDLDLRTVRLAQLGGSLRFSFTVGHAFSTSELSGRGDRTVCLDLVPRGRPAQGQRVCLIGRSGRRALYRLPLARGGPRPRFVAARVRRIRPHGAEVTFDYARVGLRPQRIDWSVSSVWKGPATCPHLCRDLVPDRGRAASRIDRFTISGCRASGPSQRFNGRARGRMVALTFDDGPAVATPQVLRVLGRYGAHATFFEIGRQSPDWRRPRAR